MQTEMSYQFALYANWPWFFFFLIIAIPWHSSSLRLPNDISIWKMVFDECRITYLLSRSQTNRKLTVIKKYTAESMSANNRHTSQWCLREPITYRIYLTCICLAVYYKTGKDLQPDAHSAYFFGILESSRKRSMSHSQRLISLKCRQLTSVTH